jgi:uncharacterized membrane protein YagU involved in acid resistance
MDLVQYQRYRQGGGTERLIAWETSKGLNKWENASATGLLGRRVVKEITGRDLADHWARSTSNLVHWATGLGWGAQFGLVSSLWPRRRVALSVLLGPTAWLSGYVILPLAKLYKPIWEYDEATLAKDLGDHVVYGGVTAAVFAATTRRRRRH